LKQSSSGDQELNTSLKQFEQKLTEINELESIKKAKEIISQAKVPKNSKLNFLCFNSLLNRLM
jgi:hypothetical protein